MQRDFEHNLRITEIFYSIQGESTRVGLPTVFVRLTGCPLRCQYCDTAYAFSGGNILSIENIITKINSLYNNKSFKNKYITVTGGEPLAQKGCNILLTKLCDLGYDVSLETSGAFSIQDIDPRVMIIMDLKTMGSMEQGKNLWANLDYLKPQDQIKIVICNQQDYDWAKQILLEKKLYNICEVLFSPSYQQIDIKQLAENILSDNLPVRLQTQLHKYIWGEEKGR